MTVLVKILLLAILFNSSALAYINECQTDIYYANGMFGDSKIHEKFLWKNYLKELSKDNSDIVVPKNPLIAYNAHELWGVDDALEVVYQKLLGDVITWSKTQEYLKEYIEDNGLIELLNQKSQQFNYDDLKNHIESYQQSINAGHGVIVVAHSQGNFFANKAYEYLKDWQKEYFHTIGVASPSFVVSGDGPRISFDNDPVAVFAGTAETIKNPNRNRVTGGNDYYSLAYHAFSYYMGDAVEITDLGVTKKVSTDITKNMIAEGIRDGITSHKEAPSQWETAQEFDKNTKDYKITVRHRFDSAITAMDGIKVYPFAPSKKLYQVTDNTGGNGWVKASCGGSEVLDEWIGKNSNEYYLINNPKREKIIEDNYSGLPPLNVPNPYNVLLISYYTLADFGTVTLYYGRDILELGHITDSYDNLSITVENAIKNAFPLGSTMIETYDMNTYYSNDGTKYKLVRTVSTTIDSEVSIGIDKHWHGWKYYWKQFGTRLVSYSYVKI